MIWVAKNLYFFNCLLDGAHTRISGAVFPEKIHEECEKCKNQKEQHNNQKTEKRKNLLCKSKGFQ